MRVENRRQTESRGCLHALPRCEGGKACEAGLIENGQLKVSPRRKKDCEAIIYYYSNRKKSFIPISLICLIKDAEIDSGGK